MAKVEDESLACSFCNKKQHEVQKLITGSSVFICNECVDICIDIIREDSEEQNATVAGMSPAEMVVFMDQYVVGQEYAKIVLAVAVHQHLLRIQGLDLYRNEDEVELQKSNVLLLGPTGTGKTLLAETIAKLLDVPFAMADATTLTEAGYVGEDVENIILKLYQASGNDKEKTQRGIIYVDEIDKICRPAQRQSVTKDVGGEGVQQTLLRLIEGTICNVPPGGGRKHPNQEFLQIDTTNILFIVGGAFVGLEDVVSARLNKNSLGFGATIERGNQKSYLKYVTPEDLNKYGLIPEFVGRLPVVASTEELTEEELLRILTEPRNSVVKQNIEMFRRIGVELTFKEEVLRWIAEEAYSRKIGARGLRQVVEKVLTEHYYRLAGGTETKLSIGKKDLRMMLSNSPLAKAA